MSIISFTRAMQKYHEMKKRVIPPDQIFEKICFKMLALMICGLA
jgi:hypothetical protein